MWETRSNDLTCSTDYLDNTKPQVLLLRQQRLNQVETCA